MRESIMLRLNLLPALLLVMFIMAMAVPATGTTYYVDAANGNDSNSGTSPSTAWKTTSKVSGTSFSPGDFILFKRGEMFRGGIYLKSSGTSGSPIVYGAYGDGDKPLFLGSISLNDESDWTSLGSNLWASPGESFPSDVGFMLLGEECAGNVGIICKDIADVDAEKEFWYDTINHRVVLYCIQNPAIEYPSIEIGWNTSQYDHFIEGTSGISYIHIENLEIKYWNSHAMAFIDATGIEIRNCDISFGGGVCYWKSGSGSNLKMARMGNGVEFWTSVKDCIVDGCKIGQCYDSGVTIQGQGTQSTVSNIYFNNNILWANDMASFEIAYVNNETTLENIHFKNNISIGTGRGWSRSQKLSKTLGWDVTTWAGYSGTFDGFYLKNNVYYSALDACMYYKWQNSITNFEMDSNYYYKPEHIMFYWGSELYAMDEFSDYQSSTGQDANSIADFDKFVAQNAARAKISCEDLFFLNTLFQETDSIVSGNLPTSFDLIFPADGALAEDSVTLSWETASGTGSDLDHYEVWFDCAHIADIPASTTNYMVTGLGFGEHNWYIIAIDGDGNWRQSTSNNTFVAGGSSNAYILTIESGTGSGYYGEYELVDISPNALTGKKFDQWTGDTGYLNSPATTSGNSVTMPASDITLAATYTDILYSLTVENGSGSGTDYIYGQVVEIVADAAPEGQEFYQWMGDVDYIVNVKDSITSVIMPASDITVTATYKTASEDLPLFNWNMEAANVVLDEGGASKDLTNSSLVTTGGIEPNPPGYGSVGAIFNGSDQYLSLGNSDYGDRALNGTDTDGTIYVALNPDIVSNRAYFWSLYQAINGQRQLALTIENGMPVLSLGYNSGNSYQDIPVPHTFSANEDIIVALSLDVSTKEYTFLAWDVANDEYYSISDSDQELIGTYNTGSSDLVIGGRSDFSSSWFFDGTIYWVRVYDEAHSLEKMKEIIENRMEKSMHAMLVEGLPANAGITLYPNPAKTKLTITAISGFEGVPVVEIYNQTGEQVYRSSQSNISFPYQLDISSFSTGIYFIKVSDGEKQETVKVIKQ